MLFLGVSVRVFPEEIILGISRLSKDHLHQCVWVLVNPLRARIEQKGRGRVNLLSLNWNINLLLPSDISAPSSYAF